METQPAIHKRPTIDDVARLAGLSTATVSRYINGSAVVSEHSSAKIQEAIAQLQYVPHSAAKILASNKTFTLGLLIPLISGDFFAPLLRGVEREAMGSGYSLLVHSTQLESKSLFKRVLAEHNTDGLIIFTDSVDEAELQRLSAIHFPTVLLHRTSPPGLNIPFITIENKGGVLQLMDHLIQVHHRRQIVHLRGEAGHEDAEWREQGYREALKKHRIAYDPALVEMGAFNAEQARRGVRNLLANKIAFDAVFAGDDESASGAMMELREAGMRVPQDVAVVGFDDLSLAAHLSPPLTTVHSPIEEVAQEATKLLLRIIRGETVCQETRLPTHLVIRQSCGCF